MKASVNTEKCIGHGICQDICPDVFELKDMKSHVKVDEVPSDAEALCKEAAESCPENAISLS